jgi:hypothetical protein
MIPFSVLDWLPSSSADRRRTRFITRRPRASPNARVSALLAGRAPQHAGYCGAATVVIGFVAAGVHVRVGAGGVMRSNHSHGHRRTVWTLESPSSGSDDLGLGRAPGTDRSPLARCAWRNGRRVP